MFNLDYMKDKNIIKEVLRISIPAIIDTFCQNLMVSIDMMMVGKISADAISSVGIGSAPYNTVLPALMAVGVGASAIISRAFGANNKKEAKRATVQSIFIAIPIALLLMLIFWLFSNEIVSFIAKDKSFNLADAISYHNITTFSFVFVLFNIVFFNIFRAIGRTKIPMLGNGMCLLINMFLNYIFIFVLKKGVTGAAIATMLARSTQTMLSFYLIFFRKSEWISLGVKDIFTDFHTMKRIVKVGIPAAIEQLSLRGGMLIFEIMVISLGSLSYASHKIALTAESYSFGMGFGISMAATTLVGQELGRDNPKKSMQNGFICMTLGMIVMSCMGLIFFIMPNLFVSLFTKDKEVLKLAGSALKIVSLCQPFLAITMILNGALRGAGATKSVLLVTFLGIFLIRIPTTYFFLYILKTGLLGAWVVMIIDLIFRSATILYIFKKGKWKYLKV